MEKQFHIHSYETNPVIVKQFLFLSAAWHAKKKYIEIRRLEPWPMIMRMIITFQRAYWLCFALSPSLLEDKYLESLDINYFNWLASNIFMYLLRNDQKLWRGAFSMSCFFCLFSWFGYWQWQPFQWINYIVNRTCLSFFSPQVVHLRYMCVCACVYIYICTISSFNCKMNLLSNVNTLMVNHNKWLFCSLEPPRQEKIISGLFLWCLYLTSLH